MLVLVRQLCVHSQSTLPCIVVSSSQVDIIIRAILETWIVAPGEKNKNSM